MNARQSARRFLNRKIPDTERRRLNAENGLSLKPGATFMDALAARWREMAQQVERVKDEAVQGRGR